MKFCILFLQYHNVTLFVIALLEKTWCLLITLLGTFIRVFSDTVE